MKIDVTDLDKEIIYNARTGSQTLKIIEITESLDESRREFLRIKFVNQWEEYHIEKFYPDRHYRKLYEMASAIGEECFEKIDGRIIINTDEMIGGFFNCVLTNVEMKSGEITDTIYIRQVRASHRRKDSTGSRHFKKVRKKKLEVKE